MGFYVKDAFYRLTLKEGKGKSRGYWVRLIKKGKVMSLYRRVNREGEDSSYYRKDGVLVDRQWLVANSLILKEERAVEDRVYGTLKVVGRGKRKTATGGKSGKRKTLRSSVSPRKLSLGWTRSSGE